MQLPCDLVSTLAGDTFRSLRGALLWKVPDQITTWVLRRHFIGEYAGIPILSLSRDSAQRQRFLTQTQQALQIVQRFDPVRFGRLQRQLKYVLLVSSDRRFLGRYRSRHGVCEINLQRLSAKFEKYPEVAPYVYAAVLVHEAAHGAIENGEIALPCVSHNRIEYFCDSEAAGFLRHWRAHAAKLWMRKYQKN